MGLAIEVGVLADQILHDPEGAEWFREEMATINAVLKRNGIAPHVEPDEVPSMQMNGVVSFPYSFLHYLRRAYALLRSGKPVRPVLGDNLSEEDKRVVEVNTMKMDSHLLCHSDADGYYVPVDFAEPIIDEETGVSLGSSQQLLKELIEVAPAIDIAIEDGRPSAEQLAALDPETDEGHRFEIERIVWLTLYERTVASIDHKAAIYFA